MKMHKKSAGGRAAPILDGVSIADISVDDPVISPAKEGEVIGNNIILEMEHTIERSVFFSQPFSSATCRLKLLTAVSPRNLKQEFQLLTGLYTALP